MLVFSTKFFVLHREAEREQKMIHGNRKEKKVCSGERLAKLTGMEICGSLSFSNASMEEHAPYFPLTGPLSLGIDLHKRDTHSGYIFSAKYSSVCIFSSNSNYNLRGFGLIELLFPKPCTL